MYYAKFGRGLMARWIIQNKVNSVEDLKQFNLDDYKYDLNLSNELEFVFHSSTTSEIICLLIVLFLKIV